MLNKVITIFVVTIAINKIIILVFSCTAEQKLIIQQIHPFWENIISGYCLHSQFISFLTNKIIARLD